MKNPHAVALGRIGGRTTGPTKARDPEKMRAAAKARWAKVKEQEDYARENEEYMENEGLWEWESRRAERANATHEFLRP